jgi:hypothetical protein
MGIKSEITKKKNITLGGAKRQNVCVAGRNFMDSREITSLCK